MNGSLLGIEDRSRIGVPCNQSLKLLQEPPHELRNEHECGTVGHLPSVLSARSACVQKMHSSVEGSAETQVDLGNLASARIVRELFCTFAACRTLLLHHSLRNCGSANRALHPDGRCRLQRHSLGGIDRTLFPPCDATPYRIACPSAGPARESTECSGR